MHTPRPSSALGRQRARFLAPLLGAALAIGLAACGGEGSAERGERPPRAERVPAKQAEKLPNVIFIYTDDQEPSSFRPRYMPRTWRLLAEGGTNFSDFVVATPLCCPSRASYVTGQYPHNNGVFANRRGYSKLQGKGNTLPIWMKLGGYRTAWVGKFLQGYPQAVDDPLQAPPGIDEYYGTSKPAYYDFSMAVNGEEVEYGSRSRDYYTNVVTRITTDLIRKQAKRPRPLFLTLNNLAPHRGSGGKGRCADFLAPAPRDEGAFRDEPLPGGPAFDERDVSDKPPFVPRESIPARKLRKLQVHHDCRLASLRAVDRQVAAIHRELKRSGELENSVIIFTSDNGMLLGEHRLSGKNKPYAGGLNQPLAVFAGREALGESQVRRVPNLTANVDLAPTILEFGRAEPCIRPDECRELDGRSLVPLMKGRERGFGPGREILIEGGTAGDDCFYAGVRTSRLIYLEHAREEDGECNRQWATELYDHAGELSGVPDPNELDNLTSDTVPRSRRPAVQAERERLGRRVARLRECAGPSCRR
jgi:N-acetylglucosamine-6-sulfatase